MEAPRIKAGKEKNKKEAGERLTLASQRHPRRNRMAKDETVKKKREKCYPIAFDAEGKVDERKKKSMTARGARRFQGRPFGARRRNSGREKGSLRQAETCTE